MEREEIEEQFNQIALKSQHLFNQPVLVGSASNPLGTYITPKLGEKPILQEMDINIDIISKISRLLIVHDQLREEIYKYQKEQGIICPSLLIPELRDLSGIKEFQTLLDRLNKLLKDTYTSPEAEKRGCVDWVEIDNFNKRHPPTETFGITFNNILQDIHTLALDILHDYNMISAQYINPSGIDETKVLYFSIGSARVINIEPYNISKPIIDFINAFNEEVESSQYATYLNILYMKMDNKYRLDFTLGAAFDHRSLIVFNPNNSTEIFDHIYIDGNYTRVIAWKKYLSDFSDLIAKDPIYIIGKGEEIISSISEEREERKLEKSLAWRASLFKTKIPKEFLLDMVMIIYLINWDGIINHSSKRDIMSIEDEANIIYYYGLHALYNENKKRFVPRYDVETQKIIRAAIKDTAGGIETFLLPEKD